MTGPATLADVKKGDRLLMTGNQEPYKFVVAARTTKTLIVVDNGLVFWRSQNHNLRYRNGSEKDWGGHHIHVGDELVRELRLTAYKALNTPILFDQLQKSVAEHRAACDRAEAALRDLGEWE